jgi:hypothetical protein
MFFHCIWLFIVGTVTLLFANKCHFSTVDCDECSESFCQAKGCANDIGMCYTKGRGETYCQCMVLPSDTTTCDKLGFDECTGAFRRKCVWSFPSSLCHSGPNCLNETFLWDINKTVMDAFPYRCFDGKCVVGPDYCRTDCKSIMGLRSCKRAKCRFIPKRRRCVFPK